MGRCAGRRAGVPKGDPASGAGQRREAGHRRQQAGKGAAGPMDPELLKLPLGAKVPVPPGSRPVFYRAKLGEKLHQPSGYFNLGDPYVRLLGTEYNSLHDPHLQWYHSRKDNLRRLKREGLVTRDGKVVCTLKQFNEYRQYLTTLKLEAEEMSRHREPQPAVTLQERLQQHRAQGKAAPKVPKAGNTSRLGRKVLKPQQPSCPPAPKSSKRSQKPERCRRGKGALDKGQPPLGQAGAELPRGVSRDTDSKKKPGLGAACMCKSAFEQQTHPSLAP